ncbi:MAG: hypothetical protein B7Z55_17775, partial [Planctomycetales bacterium 12-60-4]
MVAAAASLCLCSLAKAQKSAADLVARLASVSTDEQLSALDDVAQLGASGAEYAPAVAKLLGSSDLAVRLEAVVTLGELGSAAKAAVPELLKLLQGNELLLKHEALSSLRKIRGQPESLAKAVLPLLGDDDRMIRVEAAATVVALDLAGRKEALATLVEALKDGRASIRAGAVPWLTQLGADAVPALQVVLKSGGAAAQASAVEALGNMGPDSAALLSSVADALGDIAANPKDTLPVLAKLSQHESPAVRVAAVEAIGAYGRAASGVVATLQKSLSDGDVMVRLAACDALGALGPEAKSAIGSLSGALSDAEGAVTLRAAEALGKIGPAAVPELEKLLDDDHYGTLALQTLELMGPVARPASVAIAKQLEKADGLPQRNLCLALAAMGADLKVAGPILKKVLNDPQSDARAAAAYTLGRLGDRSAIKDLTNVIEDEDPMLRLAAAWSLLHMDPGDEEYVKIAVPRLTEALSLPNPQIRLEAARTLAGLGARASSSVPALVKCLTNDDSRSV